MQKRAQPRISAVLLLAALWISRDGATMHICDGSAATLEAIAAEDFTIEHARHLLMRAGFGGSPERIRAMHALGLDGMVDALVDYEAQADELGPFPWRRESKPPTRLQYARMSEDERRQARRALRVADQRTMNSTRAWWVRRMLTSKRPLEERMTLFWHGHFTTSYRDVRRSKLLSQQNELLRAHATGNFGELLVEISRDPAMLAYLNNNQNRKGRPNENYAREVMELFSLGIGNYDEADIREVARAFTGWSFDRAGQFRNNRWQHDNGTKTIFGSRGRYDGFDVCRLLLEHRACAPYIAGKIFSYFAYEKPEAKLVEEMGHLLRSRRFEIKPLLRAIFKSRAFYSTRSRGRQIKSPIVLLVSTAKLFGMDAVPGALLARAASQLGQELFAPPNVKGWSGGLSWITTSSLLERNNICGQFMRVGVDARARQRRVQNAAQRRRALADRARAEQPTSRSARRPTSRPVRRDVDKAADARPRMDMRSSDMRATPSGRRDSRASAAFNSAFSACRFARQALGRRIASASVEDLVDALAKRVLVVDLAAATRAEIVAFAKGLDGSLPLRVQRLSGSDMERKLRELLHLLMSTPEFQVC